MKKFAIPVGFDSARLDDVVAKLCGISKRKAKALLDARLVFLDGRRAWIAGFTVRSGQNLEVSIDDTPDSNSATPVTKIETASGLSVLYQDDDIFVFDKPSGILSNGEKSLEELVRTVLQIPKALAVHRLDRDTTGCILFARDGQRKERLEELFRKKKILKVYVAISEDALPDSLRKIDAPLEGKPAVTHIRKIAAVPQASYLEIKLETGRMHQIRKHLSLAGYPIVGDKEYANKLIHSSLLRTAARQMLHAQRLEFVSPFNNKKICIESPLPEDFVHLLEELRLHSTPLKTVS